MDHLYCHDFDFNGTKEYLAGLDSIDAQKEGIYQLIKIRQELATLQESIESLK